jgi:hypothetical protein
VTERVKDNICFALALGFFVVGLAGVGTATFISCYGVPDLLLMDIRNY